MSNRSLLLAALCAGLFTTADRASAGPFHARFFVPGGDIATTPGAPWGSRFEGNPVAAPTFGDGSNTFQGMVYNWLAVMRFQSPADFAANHATAVEVLPERPFTISMFLGDGPLFNPTYLGELNFTGTVSGHMTYDNPQLNVTFDEPSQVVSVSDGVVTVTLDTIQHPFVTPHVTYSDGVTIPEPLPFVTDLQATIDVVWWVAPPPGEEPESAKETPEPGTLTLAGLSVAAVAARRLRRSRRTSATAA